MGAEALSTCTRTHANPSRRNQARGKEALRGPAYHQRLLPAHTQLKFRQPGQGGEADGGARDLRAELLAAEAAHFAKKNGGRAAPPSALLTHDSGPEDENENENSAKRPLELASQAGGGEGEDEGPDAKRRRILEETRDIDADSESDGSDKDDEDDDDDDDSSEDDSDDEDAELQRELEKIRRERAEKRAREEAEKAAREQEDRERDIAYGNPLLNPKQNFNMKRRYVRPGPI